MKYDKAYYTPSAEYLKARIHGFEPELGKLEDIFMHVTKGNLA